MGDFYDQRQRTRKARRLVAQLRVDRVRRIDAENYGPMRRAALVEKARVNVPSVETWAMVLKSLRHLESTDDRDPFAAGLT